MSNEDCCICLASLRNNDERKNVILECKHEFHHICLQQWLNVNDTCPLCRRRILGFDNRENEQTTRRLFELQILTLQRVLHLLIPNNRYVTNICQTLERNEHARTQIINLIHSWTTGQITGGRLVILLILNLLHLAIHPQ